MGTLKKNPLYLDMIPFQSISRFSGKYKFSFLIIQFKFYSDAIGAEMLTNEGDKKIGGPGLTVEIDESMFGKRRVCKSII